MVSHTTGTREQWRAARNELLAKEEELTRRADELAAERRELPWVPIEKEYRLIRTRAQRHCQSCLPGARS